ncbi:hypothetical protein [Pseudohongiella spirulinae]|uniref:Lipoprotein n=1 Tax=Pseudohongiella spirulinae TaxID=1249552 RepID=A0A0S2KB48_9GAMM|nr:hypothetical protein [Pseudohongiella spirulinae]ALO45536.1 hypothetical protein PS2015_864 [Pseudohongiella spirulinae]
MRLKFTLLFAFLLALTDVEAQAPRPGSAAQQSDPNTVFAGLRNTAQSLAVAERCEWSQEVYRMAGGALLNIQIADLKAQLGNPQAHQQIDAGLAQAVEQSNSFSCQGPDGQDVPQRAQLETLIEDQYWRMVAHIDAFAGSNWERPISFSPEERSVLDEEVAQIRAQQGYGYYAVFNPLESIAGRTLPLICRERNLTAERCGPVPAEAEPLLPIVQVILNETEQFARAVLVEKASQREVLLAALNGQPENYFALGQDCRMGARVVNMGQARIREFRDDPDASSWQELALADTQQLGQADSDGWMLMYRNNLNSIVINSPWHVIARNGGEWAYEDVLLPFELPAELPEDIHEQMLQDLEIFEITPTEEQLAQLVEELKQSHSDSYTQVFLLNGSRIALNGNQELQMNNCWID